MLEEIAIKYKTQKVPHGYMPIYEKFFSEYRHQHITLVEIGVAEGASIKTWAEYFTRANIIGIDASPPLPYVIIGDPKKDNLDVRAIKMFECDTKDEQLFSECCDNISRWFGWPSIIIDDASHIAGEQLAAFKKLWPILKPGGWYVIEDLFALYDQVWNPGKEWNIIDEIQSRMKSILVGGDEIQEVHWFGRNNINGIVFLRKRHEPYRIQPLEEFKM